MPKEWFNVSRMTALSDVPVGGQIHFIGVCGVAMGQLAVALSGMGYDVSGSDHAFYEPMGSFLRSSSVKIIEGYSRDNISSDIDLVVIGNAISYGHEEVTKVEEAELPYTCFSELLREVVIEGKLSIVCCGTHGKSTTTALTHHILKELGRDPSFFVGGVIEGEALSLYRGNGTESVVEGDEYDTAFFAKVPKFTFYRPDIAIINAIEFDHADIYSSIDDILKEFDKLVALLPAAGTLLCCIDFPLVKAQLEKWRLANSCNFITFGQSEDADIRICKRKVNGLSQSFTLDSALFSEPLEINLNVSGVYNARNATAAVLAAVIAGVDAAEAAATLLNFKKVKRRLDVRLERADLVLIEDFAHHPTSVQGAIFAVREAYPDFNLLAIFEPRTNTSRRKVFQSDYIKAFGAADKGIIARVQARNEIDPAGELLDVEQLAVDISSTGTECITLPDAAAIHDYVLSSSTGKTAILVMSNGSFDNLIQKLETSLRG